MLQANATRELVIFGAGGHATSLTNVAISAGFTPVLYVDPGKAGGTLRGVAIVEHAPSLAGRAVAVAAGDNALRQRIWAELAAEYPDLHAPTLVHASAVVSLDATVGDGSVVMPGAVIGPNTAIGRFCIINTRAAIDHDCRMADFASLAPGAVIGGDVQIGGGAAIGIGAVIRHGLTVGDDAVLGANSYLHRDLPPNVVAYGSPARVVRGRKAGDPYLG